MTEKKDFENAVSAAKLTDEQLAVLKRRFGLDEKIPSDHWPKTPGSGDDGSGSSGAPQILSEHDLSGE